MNITFADINISYTSNESTLQDKLNGVYTFMISVSFAKLVFFRVFVVTCLQKGRTADYEL